MTRIDSSRLDSNQREFIKLVRANAHKHRPHEVFRDFCEIAAITLSNALDRIQFQKREARYFDIIERYERAEIDRFAHMLAHVVESLDGRFHDCLGQLFMALELGDHWKGQFFTPYEVSSLMARMTLGDVRAEIAQRQYLTFNEPACGAGGMLIAAAEAMREAGVNYQCTMHAVAVDIDLTAAHMCYTQLALLHVPAIVVHGNALWPDKSWDHWATPAHILGGWDSRLVAREERDAPTPLAAADQVTAPGPVPSRHEIAARRIEAKEQLQLF